MEFKLADDWGYPLGEAQLYQPFFGERCQTKEGCRKSIPRYIVDEIGKTMINRPEYKTQHKAERI